MCPNISQFCRHRVSAHRIEPEKATAHISPPPAIDRLSVHLYIACVCMLCVVDTRTYASILTCDTPTTQAADIVRTRRSEAGRAAAVPRQTFACLVHTRSTIQSVLHTTHTLTQIIHIFERIDSACSDGPRKPPIHVLLHRQATSVSIMTCVCVSVLLHDISVHVSWPVRQPGKNSWTLASMYRTLNTSNSSYIISIMNQLLNRDAFHVSIRVLHMFAMASSSIVLRYKSRYMGDNGPSMTQLCPGFTAPFFLCGLIFCFRLAI